MSDIHKHIWDCDGAERVADESVAEVALLARGASVARHGEEPRIKDQLVLLCLPPDDGCEN